METVDENHGFAMKAWKEMGQPEPPTREQTAELRKIAIEAKKEYLYADAEGKLMLDLNIAPWNIVSIREE
jgi:xylan 1,4-beta-xylosidase